MATTLLDPTNETAPATRARLARLSSLEGVTVGLLDISKPRGDLFLDRLEEALKQQGAAVKTAAKGIRGFEEQDSVPRTEQSITGSALTAVMLLAIVLSGTADAQDVVASGVGDYEGGDLRSRTAVVNADGMGAATVWATEELDVNASAMGKVFYYGHPEVTQQTAASGAVTPMGDK